MSYEESFKKAEDRVKLLGHKYLGWDNGRSRNTEEQNDCFAYGHSSKGFMFDVQGNARGSKNIHGCNECMWYSYYDCSD